MQGCASWKLQLNSLALEQSSSHFSPVKHCKAPTVHPQRAISYLRASGAHHGFKASRRKNARCVNSSLCWVRLTLPTLLQVTGVQLADLVAACPNTCSIVASVSTAQGL